MLRQSFCHLPSIGPKTEQGLWAAGVRAWDDVTHATDCLTPKRRQGLIQHLEESARRLDQGNAAYFGASLPSHQQWRLFREFRHSVAYLDIETTGMMPPHDHITTIALYDGQTVRHYVHGQNLDDFPRDVADYRLLVTYNGKCFDVPFINSYFGIELSHGHIDLRYVLAKLGYTGGLKACETKLGLSRGDTTGLDGYFAVLLWHEYQRSGDPKALETLLAYNVDDVLSLEVLMTLAYNRSLTATPFAARLELPEATLGTNPFHADRKLVDRVLNDWAPAAYAMALGGRL